MNQNEFTIRLEIRSLKNLCFLYIRISTSGKEVSKQLLLAISPNSVFCAMWCMKDCNDIGESYQFFKMILTSEQTYLIWILLIFTGPFLKNKHRIAGLAPLKPRNTYRLPHIILKGWLPIELSLNKIKAAHEWWAIKLSPPEKHIKTGRHTTHHRTW